MRLYETHADGFRAFDRTAGGSQRTRITINTKNGDVVGVLVGGEQKSPRRIDTEIAGSLSTGWFVLDEGKLAGLFVDGEYGNAVVTTVRAIDELAVGMDTDFGRAVVTGKIPRESGDGLDFVQGARFPIVSEDGNLGGHLQIDESKLAG